jgi:molecular chaperone DnaK
MAQEVFELTVSKRLDAAKAAYAEAKQEVSALTQENGNDREKHQLREILAREQTFTRPIQSASKQQLGTWNG